MTILYINQATYGAIAYVYHAYWSLYLSLSLSTHIHIWTTGSELAKYSFDYRILSSTYENEEEMSLKATAGLGGIRTRLAASPLRRYDTAICKTECRKLCSDIPILFLAFGLARVHTYRHKMEVQELYRHLNALRPKLAARLDKELGLSAALLV